MVKLILRTQLLFAAILLMASANTFAGSGGPLSPEQAAYNVNYYALNLTIDPVAKTIGGSDMRSRVKNNMFVDNIKAR